MPVVTHRRLLTLFLPLAFSGILYPLSRPIINAALARSPDPITAIVAFAVAYSISMPLQSPMFGLRQVVTALAADRQILRLIARINWMVGVGAALLILSVALTPTYEAIVVGLMEIPPDIARVGPAVLAVIAAGPLTTAGRGYYQGILVRHGISIPVGVGAIGFLATVTALLWVGVLFTDWEGALLAAIATTLGQVVYLACVWQPARSILRDRIPDLSESIRPQQRSHRYILGFYVPIAVSTVLMTLVEPMIQSAIARSPQAEASLAAYSVCISFIWLVGAPLWNLQQVVISQVSDLQSYQKVSRFAVGVTVALTVLLGLLAIPPVARWLFGSVIGITGDAWRVSVDGFKWLVLAGAFMGIRSLYHGVLTCRGQTRGIQTAAILRAATLVLTLVLGVLSERWNGFIIAAVATLISGLAEVVLLRRFVGALQWDADASKSENGNTSNG